MTCIIARGIAGIGAGGVLSMVMIIIADLVSLRDRGRYQGATFWDVFDYRSTPWRSLHRQGNVALGVLH
ncbi:hypothetical protein BGZ68_007985 [Mortierella alpina]|nr:hypothetical protein BGZ68_007985 [Mortierella alpina]